MLQLSGFPYQGNRILMHTDIYILLQKKKQKKKKKKKKKNKKCKEFHENKIE